MNLPIQWFIFPGVFSNFLTITVFKWGNLMQTHHYINGFIETRAWHYFLQLFDTPGYQFETNGHFPIFLVKFERCHVEGGHFISHAYWIKQKKLNDLLRIGSQFYRYFFFKFWLVEIRHPIPLCYLNWENMVAWMTSNSVRNMNMGHKYMSIVFAATVNH